MSERRSDVALIATGGPRSVDDVAGFLERASGEAPGATMLRAATEQYGRLDAAVPVLDVTSRQAAALEANLRAVGVRTRVRHGFLAADPSIADCLAELDSEHVVVMSLDPLAPRRAGERVRTALAAAQAAGQVNRSRRITVLDAWGAERGLARALSRRIAEALDGSVASEWALIFVARSLPLAEIDDGDPFVDQLQQLIAQILPTVTPGRWDLAFIGRGRGGRWLEPEPDEVAREQAKEGWNKVLVVPLGFVADDLATLVDLDIILRERVRDLGMKYRRARTLDDSSAFIAALSDIVTHHLTLEPGGQVVDHPQRGASPASQA